MKFCSQCGAKLPDEAKFCDSCGAAQQVANTSSNPSAASDSEKKTGKRTLGQTMMDNFRTNMALQKERRKNFKWWYWVIIAIALAYFLNF